MDFLRYLSLEAIGSYDRLFHGVIQGQLSFTFPLGRRTVRAAQEGCCDRALTLARRAIQRVDRFEMIVVQGIPGAHRHDGRFICCPERPGLDEFTTELIESLFP
jgi:hypothetical protein